MTDQPPLTDEEMRALESAVGVTDRLVRRIARALDAAPEEESAIRACLSGYVGATQATAQRLVAEVRRLRAIEHEARLVLLAALDDQPDIERLRRLHVADLARRLDKLANER